MSSLDTIIDLLKSGSPLTYLLLYIVLSFLIKEWNKTGETINDLKDKVNDIEKNISHVTDEIKHTNENFEVKIKSINDKIEDLKGQLKRA